jgi:hypothetical protein
VAEAAGAAGLFCAGTPCAEASAAITTTQAMTGLILIKYSSSDALTDAFYGPPSKVKTRFQSFFMLMTTQPCFVASSYKAWVKVPTLVAGSPSAGP